MDNNNNLVDLLLSMSYDEPGLEEYYGEAITKLLVSRNEMNKQLETINRDIKRLQHMKERKINQARVSPNGKANIFCRKNPKWAQE